MAAALDQYDAHGLALLLEHSADIVVVLDEHATIRFANPAGQRLLGHPAGALLGTGALDFVHPDDRAATATAFAAIVAGTAPTEPLTVRLRDRAGGWRHTEVLTQNLLDGAPISGIVLNIRDITDRVQAEADLRASERRFRELADNAPDFIFRCTPGPDAVFEYASPALHTITGYRPEDLYARPALLFELLDTELITELMDKDTFGDLSAPIEFNVHHRNGATIWVQLRLTLHRDLEGVVTMVDGIVRDLTERKRVEEERLFQAMHDPLTALPNRALFYDRLDVALARADRLPSSPAILFLDLDGFKSINDQHGHAAGDKVLRCVAQRITGAVRPGDTVARLGGDEFLVLCDDIADDLELDRIRHRIRSAVVEPIQLDDQTAQVDVSIGAVRAADAHDADTLLRLADEAMYVDKEHGKAGTSRTFITRDTSPTGRSRRTDHSDVERRP